MIGLPSRSVALILSTINTTYEEEAAGLAVIMNNPATEKHFELHIKTLQDAPRDPDKLIHILKAKQKSMKKHRTVKA